MVTNIRIVLSECEASPARSKRDIEFTRIVSGRHQGIVGDQVHNEVRQAEAEFATRDELGARDRCTIHISAVARTQIFDSQLIIGHRQTAMPPTDPAVVDAERDVSPAANLGREAVEYDLTRRSQWILANKAKFHGSQEGFLGGQRSGKIAGWFWMGGGGESSTAYGKTAISDVNSR